MYNAFSGQDGHNLKLKQFFGGLKFIFNEYHMYTWKYKCSLTWNCTHIEVYSTIPYLFHVYSYM